MVSPPSHWTRATLRDCCVRPDYGYTTSASTKPVGPRFLRITDIQDSKVDWEKVPYAGVANHTSDASRLRPGDIVIARIGATTGKAFLITECPEAVFASYLIRVRTKPNTSPEFLSFFFQSAEYWNQIDQRKGGRLKGGVNIPNLESLTLFLPPPPEQRAIAHVLQTVQDAKEARQRELALERERKAALTEHLFTHGVRGENDLERERELPSGWNLTLAGELIAEGPQNGLYKPLDAYGAGTYILRINDFDNDGILAPSALNRVRLSSEEVALYRIRRGDILINRVNSLSHLGKSLLVGEASEPTVFESNMMRLHVDESKVLPGYFFRHLLTESTRRYMRGRAKRAVAQSSISQGDVRSIPISLPPIHVQRDIESILDACDRKLKSILDELALLQELFNALLKELITGQVSVEGLIDRGPNG